MVKVETMKRGFLNAKRIIGSDMDYSIGYELYRKVRYGEVKRWYYVFFYEKKGGKVRGVLGKDRTKVRAIL